MEALKSAEVVRNVANILATNVAVCSALGQPYAGQLNLIFLDMLAVYRMYRWGAGAGAGAGAPHAPGLRTHPGARAGGQPRGAARAAARQEGRSA